jgi:hypothetical protein
MAAEIKTRFFLFCDYALISNDGKLSIIGEFDHLYTTSDNFVLSKAFLVASLVTESKKEFNLILQLLEETEGIEVVNKPINVTSGEDGKLNVLFGFESIKFNKAGYYKAIILKDKDIITQARLHIVKVKTPKPAIS